MALIHLCRCFGWVQIHAMRTFDLTAFSVGRPNINGSVVETMCIDRFLYKQFGNINPETYDIYFIPFVYLSLMAFIYTSVIVLMA